jgi:hypothetical protein
MKHQVAVVEHQRKVPAATRRALRTALAEHGLQPAASGLDLPTDPAAVIEAIVGGNLRYLDINAFGGSYTVPARSTDIVGRVIIPGTGRLLTGEHVTHRVAVPVPADSPGTVSAALIDIHRAVTGRIIVEGEPVIETTQPITVRSRARDGTSVEQKPPVVAAHGGGSSWWWQLMVVPCSVSNRCPTDRSHQDHGCPVR